MPIVKTNRGHEKVHVSNLNELSVNVDGLEGLQTTTNTKLTSIDTKITVGQDVKVTGSDLQQVLMYGRNYDGTLHPLESQNDRLLVDVVELTNVGQITTSSSLPAMQICGFDSVTSRFKSLKCDSDGKIVTSQTSNRSSEVSIVSGVAVLASTQIGSDIDLGDSKTIIIYGTATGNHNFLLEHSSDGTNWFLHSVVSPTSHGAVYHFNVKAEDGLRYYRLINNNNGNTFTLNYIKL
tara:strand:+ start:987 stop:1694 length:708 start_codon:yes stop_codon:yes gene_type:complete